ncbi:MAG: MerR family transcriptional regulator, partial [Rhodoferax sp.]|nr:MerR family transcriptional regulator [Rhodoferax sp.]
MLSSLEVIETSGISRATLHNYVALGLLPKPIIRNPDDSSNTRARQLGYFPPDAIDRIERIKLMKKEGLTMADIFRHMSREGFEASPTQTTATPRFERERDSRSADSAVSRATAAPMAETGSLRLTIDKLPYPAYMLNYNL